MFCKARRIFTTKGNQNTTTHAKTPADLAGVFNFTKRPQPGRSQLISRAAPILVFSCPRSWEEKSVTIFR